MSLAIKVKAQKLFLEEVGVSTLDSEKGVNRLKAFFTFESGGKTVIATKRVSFIAGGGVLVLAVVMAWLGPTQDRTYYVRTTQESEQNPARQEQAQSSGEMAALFNSGEKKREDEKRRESANKNQRVSLKYFATQIIGVKGNTPKAIRMGSKLMGFLVNPIDTRAQSLVRVRLPRGGEASGVEIEAGSILTGQYSYSGEGEKVLVNFTRLDTPDGEVKQIQAQALDSGTYTAGISGDLFSDRSAKIAANVGISMFSGMADVLIEKESVGFSQNGVQPKATMKNGLLQGLSRAAQDQVSRTASDIDSVKDYVVVPEGKEMIVELVEDYRK